MSTGVISITAVLNSPTCKDYGASMTGRHWKVAVCLHATTLESARSAHVFAATVCGECLPYARFILAVFHRINGVDNEMRAPVNQDNVDAARVCTAGGELVSARPARSRLLAWSCRIIYTDGAIPRSVRITAVGRFRVQVKTSPTPMQTPTDILAWHFENLGKHDSMRRAVSYLPKAEELVDLKRTVAS